MNRYERRYVAILEVHHILADPTDTSRSLPPLIVGMEIMLFTCLLSVCTSTLSFSAFELRFIWTRILLTRMLGVRFRHDHQIL